MLLYTSSSPLGQRGRRRTKVRTLECPCGIRLEARNDEELARELLTHAREEHDASDLTEERAREMVASHAEGTEDAS